MPARPLAVVEPLRVPGAFGASDPAARPQWLIQREGAFWDRGRVFEFSPQMHQGTLGSSLSCHWRVTDPSVSRLHAGLVRRPRRGVYLMDLASREGTFVNGERVADEVLLMDGDRISLGGSVLLEFVDGVRPAEAPWRRWMRRAGYTLGGLTVLGVAAFVIF